jgi:hypothetical protein
MACAHFELLVPPGELAVLALPLQHRQAWYHLWLWMLVGAFDTPWYHHPCRVNLTKTWHHLRASFSTQGKRCRRGGWHLLPAAAVAVFILHNA